MNERLLVALERQVEELSRTGYPLADGLRRGLSEDEVTTRLTQVGVPAVEDIVTLFRWHDGYEPPSGRDWHGRIAPPYELLTLDRACERHAQNQDVLSAAAPYTGETTEWFTVFAADGGFCVINYGESPGHFAISDGGEIEPDWEHRPTSLADSVELWASYFEAGFWRWDGSHWVDQRSEAERARRPWAI